VRRSGPRSVILTVAGVLAALVAVAASTACTSTAASPIAAAAAGAPIEVVAAENFWGSIAAQLGGDRVHVTSIINSPSVDPHDYEPTAGDARRLASAAVVVFNGVGYDPWVNKLLGANGHDGRVELNVGDVVGVKPGANPHRWYSPPDVVRVVDAITAGYKHLAPGEAVFFDSQRSAFLDIGLARYNALITEIRTTYGGLPVGASESIFAMLAGPLGLDLITPPSFLNAITEGSDPTASDKATVDAQVREHRIKVFVFNRQNSTPDVQAILADARTAGIPVSPITETLTPATATFQDWQVAQLEALQGALHQATGR
jgi:zinc/manganese transport system substrate-binding protein